MPVPVTIECGTGVEAAAEMRRLARSAPAGQTLVELASSADSPVWAAGWDAA